MNNQIEIPYHLVVAVTLALLIIAFILVYIKPIKESTLNKKWRWICIIIFLGVYGLIVGTALISDLYYQISLNEFDLNHNGIFEKNEQIGGQQEAYSKVVNNTGRSLSIFIGIIFSSILSFIVYAIGKNINR